MATANRRRLVTAGPRDRKSSSCSVKESTKGRPENIGNEINHIGFSLDSLKEDINSQQCLATREFEGRARHVYDSVLNDLNDVRLKINTLGDLVAGQNKFKTWLPASPFRKDILENVREITDSRMCKSDESVLTVKSECSQSSVTPKYARVRWLRASSAGALCRSRSHVNFSVSGYGCCFRGHPQMRSVNANDISRSNMRHSWGPNFSRPKSMIAELETTGDDDNNNCDNNGCLRGDITDDWRVKVTPYMWDGWDIPGIGKRDIDRAQKRLKRFQELRDEILYAHNVYRSAHGCGALTACPQLTQDAQQWADAVAVKGYAQYSEMTNRGENILVMDIDGDVTGQEVANTWYREGRSYNFQQPKWQRGARNFSQMIWRATRTMGVGLAKVPGSEKYMIVVQYRPPGNSNGPGDFERNIHPPCETKEGSRRRQIHDRGTIPAAGKQ